MLSKTVVFDVIQDGAKCVVDERELFVGVLDHVSALFFISALKREQREDDSETGLASELQNIRYVIQKLACGRQEVTISIIEG